MSARFQRYDSLRLFFEIARHPSLSAAADALNMTKGAVSYQIKMLEGDLQTQLLRRQPRGFVLTSKGKALLETCRPQFVILEDLLHEVMAPRDRELNVGLSSYFAARWLSPRLMGFMEQFPDVRLRLQPMTKLFDLESQDVDIAIRWGDGDWDDARVDPFLKMPAWPVGNQNAHTLVETQGIEAAIDQLTLLRDHDDSNAWTDWRSVSKLHNSPRRDTLIIPDPNVRVQAVIDGQGIALMDEMVSSELSEGSLFRLSEIELSDYGYFLVVPFDGKRSKAVDQFCTWIEGLAHL